MTHRKIYFPVYFTACSIRITELQTLHNSCCLFQEIFICSGQLYQNFRSRSDARIYVHLFEISDLSVRRLDLRSTSWNIYKLGIRSAFFPATIPIKYALIYFQHWNFLHSQKGVGSLMQSHISHFFYLESSETSEVLSTVRLTKSSTIRLTKSSTIGVEWVEWWSWWNWQWIQDCWRWGLIEVNGWVGTWCDWNTWASSRIKDLSNSLSCEEASEKRQTNELSQSCCKWTKAADCWYWIRDTESICLLGIIGYQLLCI